MVQYQLHLMSRHENLPTLPVTRRLRPLISITHSVVKLLYLIILYPGNRPTSPLPSPTPIADHFPNLSPSATPPPLLSSARQCSLPSPTRFFDHERHTLPPVSVEPHSSSTPQKIQSSCSPPKKTTFVQSSSRLDSLIDGASQVLRQRLYSSPQSNSPATLLTSLNKSFDLHAPPSTNTSTPSRSLRSNTKQQRKAQSNIQRQASSKPHRIFVS